jgi:DNA-binding transcriptional ArsR family regulator
VSERALITEGLLEKVAERFWVYGQRTRLLLIEQLADGKPSTPSELAQGLGLSQQSVSKHLKILSQAGIVTPSHGRVQRAVLA